MVYFMKIGVDCRMYGVKYAGIGRYAQNLIENLIAEDQENEYFLIVRRDFEDNIKNQNPKIKIALADIPHYSLKEQFFLPFILYKERLDLVHFPHFNVPFWYLKKYIVTIHDLIKHYSRGSKTTTRSPLVYWLKYLGYKFIFWWTVKRAVKILVPSNFVKNELIKEYNLDPSKIVVSYEGVDKSFKNIDESKANEVLDKYKIKKPYFLYVGNVYPHKNIERLIEAIKLINGKLSTIDKKKLVANGRVTITLVIVCARNVFEEKLRRKIQEIKAEDKINFVGFVPDEELGILFSQSIAFIFPSLFEGFGLPGLEAMARETPVIASNIPVFNEIYDKAAIYFDPNDAKDMADKMSEVLKEKTRMAMIKKGRGQVKKYSWKKMARETLQIYNTCLNEQL